LDTFITLGEKGNQRSAAHPVAADPLPWPPLSTGSKALHLDQLGAGSGAASGVGSGAGAGDGAGAGAFNTSSSEGGAFVCPPNPPFSLMVLFAFKTWETKKAR